MALTKRLRFEILRRDNHLCRYCGATAPDVKLTVDHVVPTALGGSDEPSNLVTACADCNSGKSATPPGAALVDEVRSDALAWAAALEMAAAERSTSDDRRIERDQMFSDLWLLHRGHQFRSCDLGQGWSVSLENFIKAGLTERELFDLVPYVHDSKARDKWRYFCGCAWKRVDKLRERAAEIMAEVPNGN